MNFVVLWPELPRYFLYNDGDIVSGQGTDKSLFALLPSAPVLLLSVAAALVVGSEDDSGCFLFRPLRFSGILKKM